MWNIVAHIQSFFFFIKTKKIIFLEVTMTIGENTSSKCLQCIKYDTSPRKSLMWKNVVLYLFSPNIGLFIHSWSPPSLKGDGPSKNLITWGGTNNFARKGNNPENGGSWCRNGGLSLFYYFNVQLHLLCVAGKSKVSFITFWFFSLLS